MKQKQNNWKISGGKIRGSSHITTNLPCQDDVAINRNKYGISLALADGAGSRSLSHYGANRITKDITRFILKNFARLYKSDAKIAKEAIFRCINKSLLSCTNIYGGTTKDFASTLMFAATYKDKIIFGHLGDGIAALISNGKVSMLSLPDNGEFCNTTCFTTTKNAQQSLKLQKGKIASIDSIVMMSDGTAGSLFNKRDQLLAPATYSMINWLKKYNQHIVSNALTKNLKTVIADATSDDCSILIALKSEQTASKQLNTIR